MFLNIWAANYWPTEMMEKASDAFDTNAISRSESWFFCESKEVFHIISFETISESQASKSFNEPSVKLVRMDVIGTFWRATTGELYH